MIEKGRGKMRNTRSRSAKTATFVALVASISLVMTGCASSDPTPDAITPPIVETPPVTYPAYVPEPEQTVAPLTGFTVDADSVTGPSFAAKIDNHENARPQFGLELTDVVFEELVEGGITRYVAVWYSNIPNRVGPIRSIRPMDPDIASPLGGLITYSGGRAQFVRMMKDTPVKNLIHGHGNADKIYRIPNRFAPHNVVADAAALVKDNSKLAPPKQLFAYASDAAGSTAVQSGKAHKKIKLVFSNIRFPVWEYNAEDGKYFRFQENRKDVSASGDHLSAKNVVTLQAKIEYMKDVPRTILIGSGDAWIATGGKHIKATWSKKNKTDPIRFVDEDGATIRLAPGNTWVEMIPTQGSIKFE